MLKRSLYVVCICLSMLILFPRHYAEARDWILDFGDNTLDVSVQNFNPVNSMTGVTVWVDFISPEWSIMPNSVTLGSIGPSFSKIASFTVTVPTETTPGTPGKILLRLTDDQGQTWTAVEKAALEIEAELTATSGITAQYGGAGTDSVSAVFPTHDGGSIVAGQTNSFGKGQRTDSDLWVLKLDEVGEVVWHATYGGQGSERAEAIQPTGTFMLTAESFNRLSAYLPLSELQSLQRLAGKTYYSKSSFLYDVSLWLFDEDYLYVVLEHAEYTPTGYIVAGRSGGDDADLWILKLDNEGSVEWQRVFTINESLFEGLDFFVGVSAFLTPHSLQPTNDGGYIVAGYIRTHLPVPSNMPIEFWVRDNSWVMKLDAVGNLFPTKPILSSGWESDKTLYAIHEMPFGSYMAVGRVEGNGWWLTKLSGLLPTGQKYFFGSGAATAIEQSHDGSYLVLGSRTPSAGETNAVMLKLDGVGDPLWQKTIERPGSEYPVSIAQTTDDGFVMGGTIAGGSGWIVKVDTEGTTEWEQQVNIANNYLSLTPVWQSVDERGYLTATDVTAGNSKDIAVLKLGSNGALSCFGTPIFSPSTITMEVAASEANVTFQQTELFLPHEAIFDNPPRKMPSVAANYLCNEPESATMMAAESTEIASAPAFLSEEPFARSGSRYESEAIFSAPSADLPPSIDDTSSAPAIPEPGTLVLLGIGIFGILLVIRRVWKP